jgi:hypothetical protein
MYIYIYIIIYTHLNNSKDDHQEHVFFGFNVAGGRQAISA